MTKKNRFFLNRLLSRHFIFFVIFSYFNFSSANECLIGTDVVTETGYSLSDAGGPLEKDDWFNNPINQDGVGVCYAAAASVMAQTALNTQGSQKPRVSFMHLAFKYAESKAKLTGAKIEYAVEGDFNDKGEKELDTFGEGGSVCGALRAAQRQGFCKADNSPMESNNFKNKSEMVDYMDKISEFFDEFNTLNNEEDKTKLMGLIFEYATPSYMSVDKKIDEALSSNKIELQKAEIAATNSRVARNAARVNSNRLTDEMNAVAEKMTVLNNQASSMSRADFDSARAEYDKEYKRLEAEQQKYEQDYAFFAKEYEIKNQILAALQKKESERTWLIDLVESEIAEFREKENFRVCANGLNEKRDDFKNKLLDCYGLSLGYSISAKMQQAKQDEPCSVSANGIQKLISWVAKYKETLSRNGMMGNPLQVGSQLEETFLPQCKTEKKESLRAGLACNVKSQNQYLNEKGFFQDIKNSLKNKLAVNVGVCSKDDFPIVLSETRKKVLSKQTCAGKDESGHVVSVVGYKCGKDKNNKPQLLCEVQNSWGQAGYQLEPNFDDNNPLKFSNSAVANHIQLHPKNMGKTLSEINQNRFYIDCKTLFNSMNEVSTMLPGGNRRPR